MDNRQLKIKFIVVGDYATGKTSLLNHFFNDGRCVSPADYVPQPTMGTDYRIKSIRTERYGVIEFLLCDTSGMEQYNSLGLTRSYYRGAEGILIVFDLTNRQSFRNVTEVWLRRLRLTATMHLRCKYIIVGNKADLCERAVTTEEAVEMARANNMDYIELSSVTSDCTTVRQPFLLLAAQLISEGICVATERPPPVSIGGESVCCGSDIY